MTSRLRAMARNLSIPVAINLLTASGIAAGQAPLEFEAASIKRSAPNASSRINRAPDGSVSSAALPLRVFIDDAYPTPTSKYVGLPDWVQNERYDVSVKVPAGTPPDQITLLWRRLFADRMKLAAHVIDVDDDVYALTFARDDHRLGPQLKPTTLDCADPRMRNFDNFPSAADVMQGCFSLSTGNTLSSGGMRMSSLAERLLFTSGRYVIDRTGLTGYYSVRLTWSNQNNTGGDPADAVSIFTALREQLGLKLEPARAPVPTVVIDHIERPTEN